MLARLPPQLQMISLGHLPTVRRRLEHRSWSIGRWVGAVVALIVAMTAGPVLALRFVAPPTTAFIQRNEANIRAQGKEPHIAQIWVPSAAISSNLKRAVIASEDQKFLTHWGFDADAIGDAVEDSLEGKLGRGASTITQQTAKNLFLWSGRSFFRKGLEVYFTILLEAFLSKKRILEIYLNIAEFGPNTYGAEAASRRYFDKPASQLSLQEAATMAAVLPAPRLRSIAQPNPRTISRASWIQSQVLLQGAVDSL